MKLILPNPEIKWHLVGNQWFLDLEAGVTSSYVGVIKGSKSSYYWNAYSYFDFSNNDIGSGAVHSLEEAKKKVEETLISAGVVNE